ncbi:XkdX family protein [Paenibacillus larvae]|nr:XkdX family protein [Paenibacillus larvae]
MVFWNAAYTLKWIDADKLRWAVKTGSNPYGEITPQEYQSITGQVF